MSCTSFTSFTFQLSILQALCEVVERPTGFFLSEKMTSLDLFDMHFVMFDKFCHHFDKLGRKLT
jgi:hypothetical protein